MARTLTRSAAAKQDTPPSTAGLLTIDLGALAENWRRLRHRARPAECAAVVKADAYGIGIDHAVPALLLAGCRTFFVAHVAEAVRARAVAPEAAIYVLNGLLPGSAPALLASAARPVLGSLEECREWASAAPGRPCAVHVDTGMNRLGLPVADAAALAADHKLEARLGRPLLMSHLVAAEQPDSGITSRQLEAFRAVRKLFPDWPASLANSSGIFLADNPAFDLVRPGYALYGGNPTPGSPNPMMPVIRLEATILQVHEVGRGETVGYGASWTSPSSRRLATLSLGYADGFPRSGSRTDESDRNGSDRGAVLIAGRLCPLVGRVSMDLVVADVSGVEPSRVQRGDRAVVIGDGLDIDEVGRRAGTIGYEILTSLGRRHERRYTGP